MKDGRKTPSSRRRLHELQVIEVIAALAAVAMVLRQFLVA